MATAKFIPVPPKPPVAPEGKITLELSIPEARVIRLLVGTITGAGEAKRVAHGGIGMNRRSKKRDFSWYGGKVDHDAVREILRLQRLRQRERRTATVSGSRT